MNIVNLTPHAITIVLPNEQFTIPASGQVARATQTSVIVGDADGIPLVVTEYGDIEGLPNMEMNTIFIVSAIVRMAMPARLDIASPGDLVRDAGGQPIGCRNLVVNR